jgi:hypothetical protein
VHTLLSMAIPATLRVFRNTIAWLKFWSVRFPRPEWRATFAQELDDMEERQSELRAKAFRTGNSEMIKGL